MSRSVSLRLSLVALVALSAACASTGTSAGASSAQSTLESASGESVSRTRRQTNLITREEIGTLNLSTAYEAVQRLRPAWFRVRGADSVSRPSEIAVYLDNVRFGGVQSLKQISAKDVASMQYYDAASATMKWGTGHTRGAIAISSQ